jgi:hypothetical protein
MNAVVITPTTGIPELAKAMESTNSQPCEHWIVIDGAEHAQKVADILAAGDYVNKKIILLPENTGRPKEFWGELPESRYKDREADRWFNGHRIYASMPFLINKPYVLFLDEDNWFEPNHINSMLEMMDYKDLDWVYCLRRLVDEDGVFIDYDNCDSLGVFANQMNVNFVDMNCYMFKTEFLTKICQHLHIGHRADKILYRQAFANTSPYETIGCTGKYTVNYRISRADQANWFKEGNQLMHDLYKGNYPWKLK